MGKKRVLVGYGIDVDAVANWLNTMDGTPTNPTNVSRGIYGATVGIDRLLKLYGNYAPKFTSQVHSTVLTLFPSPREKGDRYDKYSIKATFFTPAHSVESFPSQLARVRDAGHELGLHGYTHEYISQLSPTQQQAVLDKSISVLSAFCGGAKPRGYTAPAWTTSRELIPMLEKAGVVYDHSFMHHDLQPYFAPDNAQAWIETNHACAAEAWMRPMSAIKASTVVEIPANWHLDDWPPLNPIPGRPGAQGFVDTHSLERLWREQFDFGYREYDTFIFPMSVHPQVSGKPQVILMHERIIEYINSHEGVEWMTLGDMAQEFLEGRIPGVKVEGGVDI